jgi:hypothetical protein
MKLAEADGVAKCRHASLFLHDSRQICRSAFQHLKKRCVGGEATVEEFQDEVFFDEIREFVRTPEPRE